jgi:hypothetical protein
MVASMPSMAFMYRSYILSEILYYNSNTVFYFNKEVIVNTQVVNREKLTSEELKDRFAVSIAGYLIEKAEVMPDSINIVYIWINRSGHPRRIKIEGSYSYEGNVTRFQGVTDVVGEKLSGQLTIGGHIEHVDIPIDEYLDKGYLMSITRLCAIWITRAGRKVNTQWQQCADYKHTTRVHVMRFSKGSANDDDNDIDETGEMIDETDDVVVTGSHQYYCEN